MPDPEQPDPVAPLTLRTCEDVPYTRPPAVEAQLVALVALPPLAVVARVWATRDFRHPQYVRDECLAYFLREWHRTGAKEGFGELVAEVERRVERRVRAACATFAAEVRDEVALRVTERLWTQLFTLTHPRGEFWQVAFGLALKRVISDERGRLYEANQRAWAVLRDTSGDGEDGYDPLAGMMDTTPDAESLHLRDETVHDALSAITDPRHREAFVLLHREQWPIEGSVPPTISGHFGVVPRTIRYWLQKAHAQLERWQEENDGHPSR